MNEAETAEKSRVAGRIGAALEEPSVSPAFVNRMIARVNAITRGREAEAKLLSHGFASEEEKISLAAESVVGRLMLTGKPPANVPVSELAGELSRYESFRAAASVPPEKIVADLNNGILIRTTAEKERKAAAPAASAPCRAAEAAGTEIAAPTLGAKQRKL